MTIADLVNEGSGSDADTATTPRMRRHGEFEKRLGIHTRQPLRRKQQADDRRGSRGCVAASSIEDNTDTMVSTMEWRRRVLQSQEESQAASARQHREERRRAKLEAEIERIRRHYHKQEKVLEREIVRLERRYEWAIAQLEREEEQDDEQDRCFVDGWEEEVRSDYQPTECGEGSSRCGSLVPDLELGRQDQQPLHGLEGAVADQSEENLRRQERRAPRH